MTVSTTTLKNSYSGNGSTTVFAYSFKIFASTELQVFIRSSAGVETLKSEGTGSANYSVSGVGSASGGNVTFVTAPASGETVVILRDTALTQSLDLVENDPFLSDSFEDSLDKITHQVQELDEAVQRSFKVSRTNSITTPEFTDNAAARASKALGFSSDGNTLAVVDSIILPTSLSSNGGNMIRVNSGETSYEFQTPAQVFTNLLATESNGIIAHAGSGSAEPRTITGTSNEITLANGDGVSGNPTVSIPSAVTFTGKTITGGTYSNIVATSTMAGDPTSALHIATKQYVDSVAAGLGKRSTVRAATTANITISSALNNGDSLDGVTLADGDLVLVKDQSSAEQNGIYVVGSTPARDDLFDTYDEHPGSLIAIEEGTTNADDLYLCTSNTGGTLDTTAISFTRVFPGSGGTVTSVATAGLATGGTITGSGTVTVSINGQSGLSASPVSADEFAIYDASATIHKKITTTELFGSDVLTGTAREYTKAQNFNMTALSDGANISWDLSQNQVASVTLAGNRTLDAPSNQVAGATYILIVKQDGTGSRTLNTSASSYKFPGGTEPVLSTGANAVDILTFVSDGSSMFGVAQLNFS
ncbi:tail fiber protein [uncultured Mediterranean phage uvMED]|nr:tail fiber protein [uncultured Mediterranean phage uvMED]